MADDRLHDGCFVWVPGRLGASGSGRSLPSRATGQPSNTSIRSPAAITRSSRPRASARPEDLPPDPLLRLRRRRPVADGANRPPLRGRIRGRLPPRHAPRFFPEQAVFVRCEVADRRPDGDAHLQGPGDAFFSRPRFAFVRSLISQRAACRGMTGLLSSESNFDPPPGGGRHGGFSGPGPAIPPLRRGGPGKDRRGRGRPPPVPA